MKKIFFFITVLASFVFQNKLNAQSFGVSGSLLAFFPHYKEIEYRPYSDARVVGHVGNFSPGIRIEGNYILPGYSFPVSGFNGIGFSYFFPVIDSSVFTANLNTGYPVNSILSTAKTTYSQISLRFAYEIPQDFSDFLFLHIGWGMGYMHSKTQHLLPARSPNFQYDESDFDPNSLLPVGHGGAAVEILAGGIYEFEHFSVTAQYSLIFGFGDYMERNVVYRHGLTAGIYFPIKQL